MNIYVVNFFSSFLSIKYKCYCVVFFFKLQKLNLITCKTLKCKKLPLFIGETN